MMPSGLYIIPLVQGTGEEAVTGDTAVFKYVGKLLNGNVFDNYDVDTLSPMRYKIGSGKIITGVEEGLKHIKPGGRARLLTPSSLAFGPTGVGILIPGYTPLIWDIKMIEIIKP
jgi:FKBP-type peptidyl-prolyl cis-trans isomerase